MNIIKINDYIEGTEYYGHTTQRIKGWVDAIRETKEGLQIDIQCDDNFDGHRGNTIYEELGEIIVLELQERPKLYLSRR